MPGKFFVGRETELGTLRQHFLETPEGSQKSVALHGQSGVGKTQLALKYAVDNRMSYAYIFFINASSMGILRNDLVKLNALLQVARGSGDPVADFTTWLATQTDELWLVILDNANNINEIMPALSQIPPSGHVLLTTQDSRVDGFEMIHKVLSVSMLPPEESMTLLLRRSGISEGSLDEIEVAHELVRELGYLPLAIDHAGAYIHTSKRTLQQYMLLFHTNQKELLDHRPEMSLYPKSLLGSLELSFKVVDREANAATLLSLLAFLDRAEVTEQLLKRGSTPQKFWGARGEAESLKPSESFVSDKVVALLTNEIDFDEAVARLTSLSLITCTVKPDVGRCFSMHPLVHKCVRLRMTPEQRQRNSLDALCFLAHAFPTDELGLENG